MISQAEKMKEQDKKRREIVDLKNEADTALHTTEKSLNDFKAKLA